MRVLRRLIVLALALTAQGATAATFSFTGALTLELVYFTPAVFSGQGVATTSGSGFSLPGDVFTGSATQGLSGSTPPPPISAARFAVTDHGAGSFAGSTLAGSLPLRGRIVLLGYGGLDLLHLQLSGAGGAIGSAGSFTFSEPNVGLMTVQAAAWTVGRVSTWAGSYLGTLARTGFDQRGPNGTGAVRLVTGFLFEGRVGPFRGFATLDLNFVPEPPGTAGAALGAAVLAAAGVGRSRTRSAAQEARRP